MVQSHSSSFLRASYNSQTFEDKFNSNHTISHHASFNNLNKEVLPYTSDSMERELDSLVLQNLHEQDIYASTFNFDINEDDDFNPLLSPIDLKDISLAISNYANKIQIFIDKLKIFKTDFLDHLAKIQFSQASQNSFMLSLLPRDASQLLDLESLLLVELNSLNLNEGIHTLSLVFKNWSQRTKHYGAANQHSTVFREILRKEVPLNPELKNLLENSFNSSGPPLSFLVEMGRRLDFHHLEILTLANIIPEHLSEHNNLHKFSRGLAQIVDEYLNSGSNSESSSFIYSPSYLHASSSSGAPSFGSQKHIHHERTRNDKRLEPLNELNATENSYYKDLSLIEDVFVAKIQEICIWDNRSPEIVVNNLFYNYKTLMSISKRLLTQLNDRRIEDPTLSRIGDIMLAFSKKLPSYGDYGSHAPFSMRFLVNERLSQSKLAKALKEAEEDKRLEKKAINTFLARPTYRLGQYPLLLRQILKHTPPDSSESADILEALVKIESCLGVLDELTEKEERRLQLRELQDRMFYKSGSITRFGLADEGRQIIHEGNLSRPIFGQKIKLFLFDHALLITKPRKIKLTNLIEYDLIKKPIPLDELFLDDASGFLKLTQSKSQSELTFTMVIVNKRKFDRLSIVCSCLTEKDIWVEKINTQREKFLAKRGLARLSFSN